MARKKDSMGIDYSKLKSGQVFFTNDNSLLSKLIRYVSTGGKIADISGIPSHTGLITDAYFVNNRNYVNIIEADWNGVWKNQLDKYIRKNTKLWIYQIKPPIDTEKMVNWAIRQQGLKYAHWQLGAIFIFALLRWTNAKMKRHTLLKRLLEKRQKFICSELVSRASRIGGHPLKEGDPNYHTPWDMMKSPEIEKVLP